MTYRSIFVSSDVAGVHQHIDVVARVYAPVIKHIDGLELLAFGNAIDLSKKIIDAQNLGFKKVSLHGKIGSSGYDFIDSIKVFLAESQMIPTPDALSQFGQTNEILIHQPEAKKQINNLINFQNLKYIWLENDIPQLDALEQAAKTVRELRERGINSGLMLDLCHAIGGHQLKRGNFTKEWIDLKEYINSRLLKDTLNGDLIWKGIHLPIGTLMHDSLPIDHHIHLTNFMLDDISNWLKNGAIERIVIENQNGIGIFGISEGIIQKHQKRVEMIFERLNRHGII